MKDLVKEIQAMHQVAYPKTRLRPDDLSIKRRQVETEGFYTIIPPGEMASIDICIHFPVVSDPKKSRTAQTRFL